MLDEYRKRRDSLHAWLTADPRLRCRKPAGAFYLFVDISDVLSADGFRDVGRVRAGAARRGARGGDAGRGVRRAGLHPHLLRDVDGEAARGQPPAARVRRARTRRRRPRPAERNRQRSRSIQRWTVAGDRSSVLAPIMQTRIRAQGRRGDRRVEQSQQVRQPRRPRLPQQGYTVDPDQSARSRGRRAARPTRRCSTCPGRSTWRRSTCRPRSASASSTRSRRKRIPEVWLNPGAESDALIARARALPIQPIVACSIVAIGRTRTRLNVGLDRLDKS